MWVWLPRVFRWLTPNTQSTRVSEQESFLAAVMVVPESERLLCSDMTEERQGVSSEGCHASAHFIFTAA